MAVVAIETSGFTGGVALISDSSARAELIVGSRSTYSRRLLKSIFFLLEEAQMDWKDIDVIAVSLGPGSFTGLRIGLSTAKGLCLSTGARLAGVPTLDILAQNALLSPAPYVCPVIDARRGQIYGALYRAESTSLLERESEYMVLKPEEMVKRLPASEKILFLGSGLSISKEVFAEILGRRAVFAPEFLWHPRPLYCGLLAQRVLKKGEGPHDPLTISPLYLRLSEAEEKKRANEKAS